MKTETNIHVGSRMHLSPEEMVMIQAEINYSMIYLTDGTKLIVSTTLKILQQRLADTHQFARVHRSYLVNLNYFHSYRQGICQLSNDLSIKVSRRKLKQLREIKN